MVSKTFRTRAGKAAGSIALCSLAAAANADPQSLQATCSLTSIVGTGQCQIQFQLMDDDFVTPATLKNAIVKIDNIIVYRYVNDSVNPVPGSFTTIFGQTTVACGVSHTVVANITKVGVGTVALKAGSLPALLCPTAQ